MSPSGAPRIGTYTITSDGAGGVSAVFTPLGGKAEPGVAGTIAAGGTNSTLIAGLTLKAGDTLKAGVDVVVVSAGDGVASRLRSFLDSLIGADGRLTTRTESHQTEIDQLGKQIQRKEEMLLDKEDKLVRRYAALEAMLAKFQTQSNQLAATLASLTGASK
jgi:flagellar hook-associated protein 2